MVTDIAGRHLASATTGRAREESCLSFVKNNSRKGSEASGELVLPRTFGDSDGKSRVEMVAGVGTYFFTAVAKLEITVLLNCRYIKCSCYLGCIRSLKH